MSTEVESSVVLPVLAAAAEPGVPSPAAAATTPAASSGSPPTSPATGTSSRTPFKKEKKKVSEKTDEYLLARFQGDGVRYKAKLIGVDDVGEARGDKMSQDSMMKLKGMAVAGRTQGKHKQKIWVNITMSGIKIIDEKSGVIEHEHIVNKISFIARDVTDNRAFGYVCGAEGQHQFYAIKTSQQAEPLVIDLKDLFTVIFNVRKKEAEASQKGGSGTVVENGSDALPSADGQTAKPAEQLDLFGDMSTPPDIHSPSETNDILLLDFSAEVDSNQNCIKGNPFVTSCAAPNPWASPQTENPFSSMFGFFPTPNTDPFRDDPLSTSPTTTATTQSPPPDSQISLAAANRGLESSAVVPVISKTIMNGGGLNGDSDHMGQRMSGLSNETMILALSNGQWPLGGLMAQESNIGIKEQSDFGPALSTQNPFLDATGAPPSSNGTLCDPLAPMTKDAVVISPPPQSTKAGRGRMRSAKSAANDLFGGADLFAAPSQPEGLSDPAVVDLFASTTASIAALGNLQMGPPVTCMPGATWGAATTMPSMYSMPGAQHAAYPQPSAFGGLPIPPSVWGQQMPSQYGAPPVPLGAHAWGHPPLQAGPIMGGAAPPGWGAQPSAVNPFQAGPYAMMGVQQVVPPRPPPRPPVKEVPAPPKVENSAFTALDPLGEKEKKHGKDMFKDFQMAKPPAIPARKGEQQVASTNGGGGGGAFDQYFSSKVGVLQDEADYDDFDLHEIASFSNAPLELSPAAALAPSPSRGLLDAAFSTTPAPGPAQGLNQNMFDQAFGAPDASPFGVPLLATSPPVAQTSGSSDPFGDPFGNPFA